MAKDRTNQMRLALGDPFSNRGLFADHFLVDRIAELEQWKTAERLSKAFAAIDKLYREKASRFRMTTNESQTERDFVRPVLDILWQENEPGDCYEVQVNIPNVDARRQPDYGFFRTATDRNNSESRKATLDYWRDVPALGDAKAWFASLDRQRGIDENPSSQIANYLYRSRVRWGILTNGRIWRLYEREKSSAGGVFYEVDLEEILKRNDLNAFKYFYLFFRREAFLPDTNGTSFVDRVFQGSIEYASEVGDRLKESVYDSLRSLMNGFFEHSANSLDRNDPATVKLVHDNSLIVLYRLLFLLYAEDGRLLPCDDEPYHSISLLVLHRQINQNLRSQHPYLPTTTMRWSHVCNLFRLIDEGFREGENVIVPAYNGGLFSPSHYPRIAHSAQPGERRWDIGDRYIAQAIDQLAYERESWDQPGSQDIDYKTLDVRHLGSIYEGLLELQPHVAAEPLVETLDDGKPVFKPSREIPNPRPIRGQRPRTIETSEIYLTTNRGERKATGSYYTPKYIVDYIVENTVGPLVDEAARKVDELRPGIQREIRTRQRERTKYPSEAINQIEKATKAIEEQKRLLLEPYLSLKILDPAMGSGHFLVGAADFLSLAMATDPNLIELETIGDEDPQAHYKRLVVEHCLYGVDLNPLAVELAKLSLWLHTVSQDKALSFLDHHLRCGNSLIGARVEEDLMREPPQFNARGLRINADSRQLVLGFTEALTGTHLNHFLETFSKIVEAPGGTAEGERWKDVVYREMDAVRDKFRAVANCWLAPFFGASVTPQQYQEAVTGLRATIPEWEALKQQGWFRDALAVAQEKHFFHWELEFPEIFFNPRGLKPENERGFDAVIGNPPYVNAIELNRVLSEYEKPFWRQRFESASGAFDLYILFIEFAIRLTRPNHLSSLITPNKFLSAPYAVAFRDYFPQSAKLKRLLNLSKVRVFEDPSVYPVVTVIENTIPTDGYDIHIEIPVDGLRPDQIRVLIQSSDNLTKLPENIWGFLISENLPLVLKAEAISVQLRNCSTVHASSTAAEADSYEEAISDFCGEASKKFINTGLIDRYDSLWGIESLTHKGKVFFEPCLNLSNPVVTRERKAQYAKAKIIFAKMAKRVEGFLDENGEYASANTNLAYDSEYDLHYLLAILNSRLMSVLYEAYFGALIMSGGYFQFQAPQLRVLPVRKILFRTSSAQRQTLLEKGKKLTSVGANADDNTFIDFIDQQLAGNPSHVDVVHDLLSFLAGDMIQMNGEKETEIKGFLTWLERSIGVKVQELKQQTRIRSYHEYDFGVLVSTLRANRRRLGASVDVSGRRFQEGLEREFNTSVNRLQPLKAKIEATDYLIDEIVFRLYGLNDDEIKLVKGQSNSETTG